MNNHQTIKAGIVGGTGYTGVELIRILLNHPNVRIHCVTSRADTGIPVSTVYPHLTDFIDLKFSEPVIENLSDCDVVFFATPHGITMQMARQLLDLNIKMIDLSPDFRLKDVATWERWYEMKHVCPDLLEEAVYGLPEVNRTAIAKARLIACPGCYPTAVQLGFLPLLENQQIDSTRLIADVKSGTSGAGRKAAIGTLMSEAGESVKAYAASGHRHLPEIEAGLESATGHTVGLTFVPHLMPMIRGIHATLYSRQNQQTELTKLHSMISRRYADEPFVSVLPVDAHPDT
nr:N-acetyl-gamma-glutamyl-phosphate reductase [Gammaproteobacteria bacterium]